jgi:hypothetical protein
MIFFRKSVPTFRIMLRRVAGGITKQKRPPVKPTDGRSDIRVLVI